MDSITLDKNNSIMLNGKREDLEKAREFVSDNLKISKFNDREQYLLILAVDEALSHIVSYSEEIGESHDVRLGVSVDDSRFVARIQDSRTEFADLLRDEEPTKSRAKGQLGIYLIRKIVDEVKYTYRRGFENELVLLRFVP